MADVGCLSVRALTYPKLFECCNCLKLLANQSGGLRAVPTQYGVLYQGQANYVAGEDGLAS